MRMKAVLSSTHLDSHNMRMSKDALLSAVRQTKDERAIGVGVEHDVTLPPMGKIVDAYIEEADDGEYLLMGVQEFMETVGTINFPDGTVAVIQSCPSDDRPFRSHGFSDTDKPRVAFDALNFESKEHLQSFIHSIQQIGEFQQEMLFRKSHIPDPELVIQYAGKVVAFLYGKKILDKTIEKVGEDISNFYVLIRNAIITFSKEAVPRNRPRTYLLIMPGTPHIEFVARSAEPDIVLTAISLDKLQPYIQTALGYTSSLSADKVQFTLTDTGTWKLNFLLTTDGKVIGEQRIFDARDKVMELILSDKHSMGRTRT